MGLDLRFERDGKSVSWGWAFAHGFPFQPHRETLPALYGLDSHLLEEECEVQRIRGIACMEVSTGPVHFRGRWYQYWLGEAFSLEGTDGPERLEWLLAILYDRLASWEDHPSATKEEISAFARLIAWAVEQRLMMVGCW